MNIDQMTKLLTPFIRMVESEHLHETKAENSRLKSKLKKALAQRDEWRYQAQKYQKAILDIKKTKSPLIE